MSQHAAVYESDISKLQLESAEYARIFIEQLTFLINSDDLLQ